MGYVVTEVQKVNGDTLVVSAFKTFDDAKSHVMAIIEEYGLDTGTIVNDGWNWYDEDLDVFDITISETELQ